MSQEITDYRWRTLLVVAGLIAPQQLPDDWRDTIRLLFRRFRASVHDDTRVAALHSSDVRSNGASNAPWVEVILQALTQAGFKELALIDAFNSVVGALGGFVTIELAADGASEGSQWVQAFDADLDGMDAGQFPLVKQHLPQMYNQSFVMRWKSGDAAPLDEGYNFLLETLILGLEAQSRR